MSQSQNIHIQNQTDGNVSVKISSDRKPKPEHPYSRFVSVNTLTDDNVTSLGGLSILWQIAPDRDLTGECWRVLVCLICKLDYENFVFISQPEIAEHLSMPLSSISRAISTLCKKQILERGDRIGNTPSFRLNPSLGWRGDNTSLKFALYKKLPNHKAKSRRRNKTNPDID